MVVYENHVDQNSLIDLVLEGSSDGGATWEAHAIPIARPAGLNETPLVNRVAFIDQNTGWVYDPGLFETQDGGHTWKEIPTNEKIEAILPSVNSKSQTWALAGTCPDEGQICAYHLLKLDPLTGTLIPSSSYPSLQAGRFPEVSRIGENTLLVFAQEPGSDLVALWVTNGTGSGWKKLNTPCRLYGLFSLSPDGQLWLECGILFSGADEAKGIYVSSDLGATWELRSATGGLVEVTPPSTHTLQTFGNVTGLLALSKEEALIGLSHDALYLSLDGGRDWEAVIPPLSPDNPVDISTWKLVRKPDSDTLWVTASTHPVSTRLYMSTDRGRSWISIKIDWP